MIGGRWPFVPASFIFALLLSSAHANTEKVIFLAPPSEVSLETLPGLGLVNLEVLAHSPAAWSTTLRTSLPVVFPTEEVSGEESWLALQDLNEGQRYEVRVCWPATQPTNFNLSVFDTTQISKVPNLQQSLATFIGHREISPAIGKASSAVGSTLYLRIQAAADFFATNDTLMRYPPPVLVDIILDPYLGSVFPQSLIHTAVYIVALAVVGFFLSGQVWARITRSSSIKSHND